MEIKIETIIILSIIMIFVYLAGKDDQVENKIEERIVITPRYIDTYYRDPYVYPTYYRPRHHHGRRHHRRR